MDVSRIVIEYSIDCGSKLCDRIFGRVVEFIDGNVADMWDKKKTGKIMLAYEAGSIITSSFIAKDDPSTAALTTYHSSGGSQINLGFNGTNVLIGYYYEGSYWNSFRLKVCLNPACSSTSPSRNYIG